MISTDQSSVFATLALVTCAIASVTSVLAFGLPYWVYFDQTLPVTHAGTLYDLQMRYHFGFWRYCNKVSSEIGHTDTCAAAKTSSDAEQTTVCLLILAVIFWVSSVINITLYLTWLRREKLCLYMACTSEVIGGILGTTSVIYFGVQDHSIAITDNLTLPFSTTNLHASFWLAVVACCSVAIATVLTVTAILKHTRTDASTDDKGSLSSISFSPYPTKDTSYTNYDDPDVTSSGSDYPLFRDGGSKRPFYTHFESDSSDEEMILSKAPIATALFGLKDKTDWRERIANQKSTGAVKLDITDAEQTTDDRATDISEKDGTDDEKQDSDVVDIPTAGSHTQEQFEERDNEKLSYATDRETEEDETEDEVDVPTRMDTAIKTADNYESDEFEDKRPASADRIKTKHGVTFTDLPIADTDHDEATKDEMVLGASARTRTKKRRVRPKTTLGKRKRPGRERRQIEANRLERAKTLTETYGAPLVNIGAMGSIPPPNPLLKTKRMPSEDVIKSGKRFMMAVQAYRTLRQDLEAKRDREGTFVEH